MGPAVTGKNWRLISWHLACGLNRVEWRHSAGAGLLGLWILLIGTVDLPLHAEIQRATLQLAPYLALQSSKPASAMKPITRRDVSTEFAAALPEFEKYPEQLRALNALADRAGVALVRVDYRYEPLPALPIIALSLQIDLRGEEVQQRKFLQAALDAFANLAIARLAYAKGADGTPKVEQKLQVDLYYRARPKAVE